MATLRNLSVIKACRILDVFQQHNNALTLKIIATQSGSSLAAAHRLVATLLSVGMLRTDVHGRYLLGAKLAELGDHSRRLAASHTILTDIVKKLSNEVNETAHVAVLNGDMVRYVAKAETERGLRTVTQVGKELEAYCTGVGKVLLAYASARNRRHYLSWGEFVRLTPNTICTKEELKEELDKIRSKGFAVDAEEFEEGLKCVAVPIFGETGRVIASLSISGPASRIDRRNQAELVTLLRHYSRQISSHVREADWAYV